MFRVGRLTQVRRQRLMRAAFVSVIALPVAFVAWFFLAPEDPAPYLAAINQLHVPTTWETVHTQSLRSILGSRADRYYLVDAEPPDIAPVVQNVLRSAGLEIYTRTADSDWCDNRPIGATPAIVCPRKETPTCSENGRGGPITCWVEAFRWLSFDPSRLERFYVSIAPRSQFFDVGVGSDRHRVEAANRALVTLSVDRQGPHVFWSSPTPASQTVK